MNSPGRGCSCRDEKRRQRNDQVIVWVAGEYHRDAGPPNAAVTSRWIIFWRSTREQCIVVRGGNDRVGVVLEGGVAGHLPGGS